MEGLGKGGGGEGREREREGGPGVDRGVWVSGCSVVRKATEERWKTRGGGGGGNRKGRGGVGEQGGGGDFRGRVRVRE